MGLKASIWKSATAVVTSWSGLIFLCFYIAGPIEVIYVKGQTPNLKLFVLLFIIHAKTLALI